MPQSSEEGALSYNQRALWFATQLDATAYNLAYGFRLRGAVDPELLRRALALLVERHPVLRTAFTGTEHGARRVVHARMDFELQRLYGALAQGLETAPEPAGSRDYGEFVRWQSEWLGGPEGDRARDWWREQLAGSTPVLNLPTDHPRPARQTFRQRTHLMRLDGALAQALGALAKAEGTSLYALLLAAFQVLLHRHTGQEDLLVGVPCSGRSQEPTCPIPSSGDGPRSSGA